MVTETAAPFIGNDGAGGQKSAAGNERNRKMRTKISTSTSYLFEHFDEKEAIRMLADAGYDCLDFSFSSTHSTLERESGRHDFDFYKLAEELRAYTDRLGISFNQAHAPEPTTPDDREVFDAVAKSIEIASILGVKQIVVHPLHFMTYKGNEEKLKRINYEFYSALLPHAEKNRVRIAIENMWRVDPKRKYIIHDTCASPREFCEYVDMMDSEWVIACLDIGHCELVGENIPEMIRALGPGRLHALHVHDVDFLHDNHTLPGICRVDYDEVVRTLAEIGYDGEFTLEANCFLEGFELEFMGEATRFMAAMPGTPPSWR